jgi:hypothetical protein
MKVIKSWDDLPRYGIVPLPEDACGLSFRILCDVTAKGKAVLEKALSVKELVLHEKWTPGLPEDPHVGSIMLAPGMLTFIAAFLLLENGCQEAWLTTDHHLTGFGAEDSLERVEYFKRYYSDRDGVIRHFEYAGTAFDRNIILRHGRVF